MNLKRTSLLLLAVLSLLSYGQKKPLQHSDYDGWKSLSRSVITPDANWISYEINPQQGDGMLYYYNVKRNESNTVARGINAKFSPGTEYFVYLVKPAFDETRQAKKEKKKGDDMPKNNLGIHMLGTGETELIERVKSYQIAEEGDPWMAYLLEKPLIEEDEKGDKEELEEPGQRSGGRQGMGRPGGGRQGGGNGGSGLDGTELVVTNPVNNSKHTFRDVLSYKVSNNGSSVAIIQGASDSTKIDKYTIIVFDTKSETSTEIFNGGGTLKNLTLNDDGNKFAFIFTPDTSDVKVYDLFLSTGSGAKKIVDISTPGMTVDWSVSENGTLVFSDSGDRLFFGTTDKPVEEPEDTLLSDEKYSVDVWSWHDPLLQPMQKSQLRNETRRTYQAVYHINDSRMVQLATKDIPDVRLYLKRDADIGIASSNLKYRISTSWDYLRFTDYYQLNVLTGEKTMIFEAYPSTVSFSPSGKYMVYWNIESEEYFAKPVVGGKEVSLTGGLDVLFYDELDDRPAVVSPFRVSGWIEGERYVLIPDKYDLWKMDVTGQEEPVLLTNGFGRKNNIRLQYTSLGSGSGGGRFGGGSQGDKLYIGGKEEIYFNASHVYTKQSGLFSLKVNKPGDPVKIDMGDYRYSSIRKAKDADMLIWQRGTFAEYAELHISDMNLMNAVKISNTNPQQADINWGTVELVEWMSFDGQKLQGLLYKPEDFDPSKKYPMISYFYERSSGGLHNYNAPAPARSTINRPYAISNGYLLFVPDIPYVDGYPGQSAYNAVVSGTYAMLDRFDFIDPERLGLDGQSWGGYQIAYLITQTDLYACAYSGAPVSNMTSAYGGIRWSSGSSRMHQYEQGQSRIGGTLWEKPIHYIENSPIFFVPKINTPVLIMHNDADGAVPWYQGIEFFVSLRRLAKPAWLLTYNDEAHNLSKRPNQKDLAIRKFQFFDHYLMDAPAPYWMEKGISQLEKGKKDGYELMKK